MQSMHDVTQIHQINPCRRLANTWAAASVAMCIGWIASSTPAIATLYCEVKSTPDGFVALRAAPSLSARMLVKMRPGDTILVQGEGPVGDWELVVHWKKSIYERMRKQGREDSSLGTRGWVNKRLYAPDSCG